MGTGTRSGDRVIGPLKGRLNASPILLASRTRRSFVPPLRGSRIVSACPGTEVPG